jgi:hypothetical protein
LSGECVHPLLWLLSGFSIHKWNTCFITVTCMLWLRNSSPSLWNRSKKVKAEAILLFCMHPWEFSEPILHKTCDSPV